MKNYALIGAAGLLAYAAWRYSQQGEESAASEGGDLFEPSDLNTTADNVLNSIESIFTGTGEPSTTEETGGYIQTAIGDAVNEIKNLISGNDIAEVIEAGAGYIIVRRPSGAVQKLTGVRNWRNNNPGNIEFGDYARSMGAIGTDGRFAVFPTYAMGKRAKEKLIFEGKNYQALTLDQAIARYAPPSENLTAMYQRVVLAAVGGINKLMNQYTASERSNILAAMERVEGFKVGKVTDLPMA
jgi:hypothetical protein